MERTKTWLVTLAARPGLRLVGRELLLVLATRLLPLMLAAAVDAQLLDGQVAEAVLRVIFALSSSNPTLILSPGLPV